MDRPPYPVALRLYAIAEERWAEIDSDYPGVDLVRLPGHRFLNYVYGWAVKRIDPEKREEWDAMLEAPIPGLSTEPSEAQIEAEGQSFMALMAAVEEQKGASGAGPEG